MGSRRSAPTQHSLARDAEDQFLGFKLNNKKSTVADAEQAHDRLWLAENLQKKQYYYRLKIKKSS